MEDLKELRERVDEIDEKLTALLEERMEIVLRIGNFKKKNNVPILNANREKEVIEKNISRLKNKKFSESTEKFFTTVMDLSKEEQKKLIK